MKIKNNSLSFLSFTDINECKFSNHSCSHICKNEEGSYNCYCHKGFTLAKDYKTCINGNIIPYFLPLDIQAKNYLVLEK